MPEKWPPLDSKEAKAITNIIKDSIQRTAKAHPNMSIKEATGSIAKRAARQIMRYYRECKRVKDLGIKDLNIEEIMV